jgi:hypothetical protein
MLLCKKVDPKRSAVFSWSPDGRMLATVPNLANRLEGRTYPTYR